MSGYWGLPERTAQALTPLVVNQHLRPELIYHTGDLVREEVDLESCFAAPAQASADEETDITARIIRAATNLDTDHLLSMVAESVL